MMHGEGACGHRVIRQHEARSMFPMFRAIALAALTAQLAVLPVATTPAAAQQTAMAPDAARKLYELGYPADTNVAVQRWRTDTHRIGDGQLTEEEKAALTTQAAPESFSAMTGNPFTGMGLALRHQKREDAEREAVRLCKAEGGGSACTSPLTVRAGLCVVLVGYTVDIDRRPHHRVSVAISSDVKLAQDRGLDGCQTGATHPQLCRSLVTFCGDGSEFKIHDEDKSAEVSAAR
jgi:hypothetical protein